MASKLVSLMLGGPHSARLLLPWLPFLAPLLCAFQAVDFDPHSLRNFLPRMVAVIEHNVSEGRTVYVHCTAGLGRAPASAIAYLFWFHDMDVSSLRLYKNGFWGDMHSFC